MALRAPRGRERLELLLLLLLLEMSCIEWGLESVDCEIITPNNTYASTTTKRIVTKMIDNDGNKNNSNSNNNDNNN